jgi:hypothetical protein
MRLLEYVVRRLKHGSDSTLFNLMALVVLLVAVVIAALVAVGAH